MQQQGYSDQAQAITQASVRAILAGNDIVECPIEPDRLAAVVTAGPPQCNRDASPRIASASRCAASSPSKCVWA